jgi:hypothetical protein
MLQAVSWRRRRLSRSARPSAISVVADGDEDRDQGEEADVLRHAELLRLSGN